MVAKVISGKDIKGAINYNEHKVDQGSAKCIYASGFLRSVDALSFREKLLRFTTLNERNLRAKTNTIHVSLNFDPSEKLSAEELNKIASAYMDRIGFGAQPYLVYEHHDAAHPHIHIVSTLIQETGKRIPIHNLGRNESETARKEIEVEFGLVRASSKQKSNTILQPVDIQNAIYGKSLTKQSISNIVRSVIQHYKFTSLPELNAILQQYNVTADRGSDQSRMFAQGGLVYSLVDANGKRIGIPVKASSIYGKPTLKFLEKQFRLNEVLRQPFKDPLKLKIDQIISNTKNRNRFQFIDSIRKEGVEVKFRINAEGRTYGITFIDNHTKVVFNGSALGKAYSANAILERLAVNNDKVNVNKSDPVEGKSIDTSSISTTPKDDLNKYLNGTPLTEVVVDLVTADGFAGASPEALLKLNKRKKRRKGPKR
ncbi:MAG: relaxase/mobilization nuclease domain-containing protein [Cyclobacteriaceae bacterium]|nr:relaxase/mobilization nuclease domain-containing protein [Cyclobacteriaceae bacterium]